MGKKSPARVTRRSNSGATSERRAVNAAFGILGTVGGLVIYSAVNEKFKIPAEMWGLATLAAAYLFGTSRRSSREDDEPEEENQDG